MSLIKLSVIAVAVSFAAHAQSPKFPRHTSKLTAPVNVSVELSGPAPKQPGDQFEVVGTVQSLKILKSVRLEWIIGEAAELVGGAKTQTVDVAPGQPAQVRLQLRALRAGQQYLRLTASSGQSEGRVAASGRLNLNAAPVALSPGANTTQSVNQPMPPAVDKRKLPKKFH